MSEPRPGRPGRRELLLGCAIFAAIGAAAMAYLNWPALGSETRYNGDVPQSPHWAAYHGDRFPEGDLLVEYAAYNETPLQNAIYWVGTWFLDLVLLNKIVGILFFAATAALFYLLVSSAAGVRTGVLAAFFFVIFPRSAYETSGGFSKAWAIGLILIAVHVVEARRWGALLWLMPFSALAYPVCPILIGALVLVAVLMDFARDSRQGIRGLKYLTGASSLALVPLLYKYFTPPARIGEMITPSTMKEMWERGEFGDVTIPLWEEVLSYFEHPFFVYSPVLLLMLLAGRGLVWKRSWSALVVASALLYGVAYLVIPQLYLPDRYTRYSMAILLVLWHAHNWSRVLEVFRRGWTQWLAVAVLVGATLISFSETFEPGDGGRSLNRWQDKTPVAAMSRVVAELPPPVLVAGHPYYTGDVMLQARVPVLAIHRMYHPWFSGYREEIEARLRDTFRAIYASDIEGVNDLAERYGVTHLIVLKKSFSERRLRTGRVYKPQFTETVRRLTRGRSEFVLRPPPPEAIVYEDDQFWLVRLPLEESGPSRDVSTQAVPDPSGEDEG